MKETVTLNIYLTSNDKVKIKMNEEDAFNHLFNFKGDSPLHNRMLFPGHVIDKKFIVRMSIEKKELNE